MSNCVDGSSRSETHAKIDHNRQLEITEKTQLDPGRLDQDDTLGKIQQLSLDTTVGASGAGSPVYEGVSMLPTPVMSNRPQSCTTSPLAPSPTLHQMAVSKKKHYGSLTVRPGVASETAQTRVLSEFIPANSNVDSFSSVPRSSLDPRYNTGYDSSQKRNVSTPLVNDDGHVSAIPELSREVTRRSSISSSGSAGVPGVYTCFDSQGLQHSWEQVGTLGKGTFSTVFLGKACFDDEDPALMTVAIKVIKSPHNRDSKKRLESALKRELEILAVLRHPCTPRLLATDFNPDRFCIVLPYCEGGDLFDLAVTHRKQLSPLLIRRIFAEVAIAVAYLHSKNIVHRDIKLENVLVNFHLDKLLAIDVMSFSRPIVTLTDFGLSRTIDPEDPMLVTRCGSEDYVPPELLIGLPYDGRQTDSWALGVLLYAVMESRLPFDPLPTVKSIRAKSRVAHRIARIEWAWYHYADDSVDKWSHNDWDRAKALVGNLLVRREHRFTALQVIDDPWVSNVLPNNFALYNY